MSKKRMINTKFWDDNYIVEIDPIEKLLFLYFLTNSLTDICGIYEIPIRKIVFDTGVDKDMVFKVLEKFKKDEKIYYFDGWIFIKNFTKHQIMNDSVKLGIERSLKEIPKQVLAKVREKDQSVPRLSQDAGNLTKLNLTKPNLTKLNLKTVGKADGINTILDLFYNSINPTLNYGNKTTRNATEFLIKKLGLEKTIELTNYAISVQGKKYCPVITTPYQLKEKFTQLIIFKKQDTPKTAFIS